MSEEEDKRNGKIPILTENSGGDDQFPIGMRVLAIDANSVCLNYLVALLKICRYKVTATTEAEEALQILRKDKHEFDIVITDVVRQDMDGFKLLQIIGIEMGIPVVMVSANDEQENIWRAINNGARDYLLKPVRLQEIRNIWQHVYRKNIDNPEKSSITKEILTEQISILPPKTDHDHDGDKLIRKEEDHDQAINTQSTGKKRTRFSWTADLHCKFINAIQELGEREAVPNKILRIMDIPGLTRENVASHLQKYRNILKKQQSAATAEQKNEHDHKNIASGNYSDNYRKSYGGAAYGTTGNYVNNYPGTVVPISDQQLSSFPMYLKEENPKSMEMGMFRHVMQSPQSVGHMQQGGIMHNHMYGNPPPAPLILPTKTYQQLPAPEYRFPNVFPGIKLHDGYIGFSRNQVASPSSAKLYPYPSGAVCHPSQMPGGASSSHDQMGASSQHASVAWPLQTFVPGSLGVLPSFPLDQDERRSSFNFCETGDANLNRRNTDDLDSMEDSNLADLKGKGKDKDVQYFSAHPDAESGFHNYSSSFMDDDLTAMVKEFNNDSPKNLGS